MSRQLICIACGKTEDRAARGGATRCIACAAVRVQQLKHRQTRVGRLIHLLIEERAKVIALERAHRPAACLIHESDRGQARREIENEVLKPNNARKL